MDEPEDWETSPIQVIEEAVKALHKVYLNNRNNVPPIPKPGSRHRHRRSQSESVGSPFKRTDSFQRWKGQMQRALRLGSSMPEDNCSLPFDPEILADQKRQWYQSNSKSSDYKRYTEPTSLFEHFIVAGLHPEVNLKAVDHTFALRNKQELNRTQSDTGDFETLQNRGRSFPSMDSKILFKYPAGKRLPMRLQDLAAFCFPSGVKAHLLQRTASLSELNELVHGQEHLSRDDLSFVFSLKVADNATLYGVCLHVQEIVQRPLAISGAPTPLFQHSENCYRYLVAAPRCYCVLTRVPFFELHYAVLNSIIAQERLTRITQFVNELALAADSPFVSKHTNINQNVDSSHSGKVGDLMASAIPVDCAMAITAAAAGINLSDDEVSLSSSRLETPSPEGFTASENLDHGRARECEKDSTKLVNHFDGVPKASESHSDSGEIMHGNVEDEQTQYDETSVCRRNRTLERLGSSGTLLSSVRNITAEDDGDLFFANDVDVGDEKIMEWAEETENELLQIVSGYHSTPLPARGCQMVFQPLEHLQAIEYRRLPVSALSINEKFLNPQVQDLKENPEVNLRLAVAEEAAALSIWTTATICRVLSLENIMALVTGVLLEKQVMIVSPNLGVLAAVVLSLIPIIRPFQWQSLFLPILPEKMFDFLDAPVPYIVGLQHKPANLKTKESNLVHVNLVKDQDNLRMPNPFKYVVIYNHFLLLFLHMSSQAGLKTYSIASLLTKLSDNVLGAPFVGIYARMLKATVKMCCLPLLPRQKELQSLLGSIHNKLSSEDFVAQKHPVYKCSEVQAEAAEQFLAKMREYLESLCSDLRLHAITSVQSNDDRVSILLKDTFIDSFHSKDQPFVEMFVDTQMFSVLSDSRLSSSESEH